MQELSPIIHKNTLQETSFFTVFNTPQSNLMNSAQVFNLSSAQAGEDGAGDGGGVVGVAMAEVGGGADGGGGGGGDDRKWKGALTKLTEELNSCSGVIKAPIPMYMPTSIHIHMYSFGYICKEILRGPPIHVGP